MYIKLQVLLINDIKQIISLDNDIPIKIKNPFDTNGKVEGYYRFEKVVNSVPPKVKPPPYYKSTKPCPGK